MLCRLNMIFFATLLAMLTPSAYAAEQKHASAAAEQDIVRISYDPGNQASSRLVKAISICFNSVKISYAVNKLEQESSDVEMLLGSYVKKKKRRKWHTKRAIKVELKEPRENSFDDKSKVKKITSNAYGRREATVLLEIMDLVHRLKNMPLTITWEQLENLVTRLDRPAEVAAIAEDEECIENQAEKMTLPARQIGWLVVKSLHQRIGPWLVDLTEIKADDALFSARGLYQTLKTYYEAINKNIFLAQWHLVKENWELQTFAAEESWSLSHFASALLTLEDYIKPNIRGSNLARSTWRRQLLECGGEQFFEIE